MPSANDLSTGSGAAPIRDQRSAPRGVLPRQLQMWLMIGLAVIILGIIVLTGRSAPSPRASMTARTTAPSAMAPDRIQTYQRQLAEDEARLRHELAKTPDSHGAAPSSVTRTGEPPASDPIADEQRRREYQSLFADNVALSRRPVESASYGERTIAARLATPSPTSGAMSPRELVLLQALVNQRAVPAASPSASAAPLTPAATADQTAATPATQGAAPPKETGPIRSTDALQRLTEGTVIETVLVNRLTGSFAGPVECLVTTPVYAHDRQRIVIPAGARVLGAAKPVQTWGDSRLAVSFHRLLMPDGRSYSLDAFKGLDQIGQTGLQDEVNRHYLQVFGASIAIGAISGLAQYGTTGGFGPTTFGDEYRQAAGASLASSTGRVLERYLNVLPTITIREGYRIKIYLTNDLDLPALAPDGAGDRP